MTTGSPREEEEKAVPPKEPLKNRIRMFGKCAL
jgi:hypothetical protein